MARNGRTLLELAAEIERRADAKQDYIAPTNKFEMVVLDDKPALALANGTVKNFDVNDLAHQQIAEYAGIPLPYYRRLAENDPTLLADNVNRWVHDAAKKGDKRLVRTLDGNVRAFLSDRYRPLDNEDLADVVLPVLRECDLLIVSCEITDRRLYIKAVDKSIERQLPKGRSMGDGVDHQFFDVLSPAITIANSEVGFGALSIETGTYTKACTNLAMFGTNMRKYHTGARATISDDVYALLTDQTKQATDNAIWLQVRDMVKGAFDAARFDATVKKLGTATEDRIEPEGVVQVVEKVGRRFSLAEAERKGILARLIEGGDLTRYGLHSAITRHSQDETIAYDRASEMEGMGGDVIELSPKDWRELTAVAA